MAYKDSEELQSNENYALGEYSFRIERTSVPGSTNDQLTAICTQGGKNARKSIQIPSNQNLSGWYVEANEATADVYSIVRVPTGTGKISDLDTSPVPQPVPTSSSVSAHIYFGKDHIQNRTQTISGDFVCLFIDGSSVEWLAASSTSKTVERDVIYDNGGTYHYSEQAGPLYSHNGKTVYVVGGGDAFPDGSSASGAVVNSQLSGSNRGKVAWTMVYGTSSGEEYEEKTMLVGRFAIELEDAGGVGPGSDWTDPGDYDPDWEPEEPTHTLYVTATGALSGRHNDPIEDPSYSYIPSDKDTVKDYGCGGDGGHGGGGGAGASTVVIHKFATNQANSKEVTAIARRHGYGSGGGKGGKGGDGCILVYY